MRKAILLSSAIVWTSCIHTTSAQIYMSMQGSLMTGGKQSYYDYTSERTGLKGIGLQVSMNVNDRLTAGVGFRSWQPNVVYQYLPQTPGLRNNRDATTQFAGMIDYSFGKRLRPYVGIDAGVYMKVTYRSSGVDTPGLIYVDRQNPYEFFGFAPKAGIRTKTGFISLFAQAQYHLILSNDMRIGGATDIDENLEFDSSNVFATFDLGILFEIGAKRKKE